MLCITNIYRYSVNICTNLLFVSWQVYGNKITVRPDQINLLLLGFADRNLGPAEKKLNRVKSWTVGLDRANLPHVLLYCKKARPRTHLSVCVQSGCRIHLTKIRFTSLEITFAELFLYLSEDDERVDERRVAKVTIADRGSSSGGGADVDLTAPRRFVRGVQCQVRGHKPDAY